MLTFSARPFSALATAEWYDLTEVQGESLALQRGRNSQRDLLTHQKSPTSGDGDESDRLSTFHRLIKSLHKAWNARLDTDLYGQRSQSETVNSTLKRKYGAFVRSRQWWKQFRELTIACLIHNLDRTL